MSLNCCPLRLFLLNATEPAHILSVGLPSFRFSIYFSKHERNKVDFGTERR